MKHHFYLVGLLEQEMREAGIEYDAPEAEPKLLTTREEIASLFK